MSMALQKAIGDICDALQRLPKEWDGREAIVEMKHGGSRQWKQMEWVGFYFEFLCERALGDLMDMPGPSYGRASFDGMLGIPWDFKAHAENTSSHQIIVNDHEAVSKGIADYGSVGLILAVGPVEYNDERRSFQQWHQELKGGPSDYTRKRIQRGAWSRLRKVSFHLREIDIILLDKASLNKSGSFQKDFRNADGSPRQSKVLIDLEKLDKELVRSLEF